MASRAFKSLKVYVNNIPWTVSPGELRNYFSKFGQLKSSRIVFSRDGWSRGFGFVTFSKENDFQNALEQKEHYLGGQMIQVQRSVIRGLNDTLEPSKHDLEVSE